MFGTVFKNLIHWKIKELIENFTPPALSYD